MQPAQGIQDGSVQHCRTEAGNQGVQILLATCGNLGLIIFRKQAKRRMPVPIGSVKSTGQAQRSPQLFKIILIGKFRIFIEPLR